MLTTQFGLWIATTGLTLVASFLFGAAGYDAKTEQIGNKNFTLCRTIALLGYLFLAAALLVRP